MDKFLTIFLLFFIVPPIDGQEYKPQWVKCFKSNCLVFDPYYSINEKLVWEGKCQDKKAFGSGVLKKLKGDTIESVFYGNYSKGIRTGYGKLKSSLGTMEGFYKDGYLNGKGKVILENGIEYEGEFFKDLFHGYGSLKFNEQYHLKGYFIGGLPYKCEAIIDEEASMFVDDFVISNKVTYSPRFEYSPILNTEVIEYFDINFFRCDKEDASYYRKIKYVEANIPKDTVKLYYNDGNLYELFVAEHIDYFDHKIRFCEGEYISFFKNGSIKERRNYKFGKIEGDVITYDEDGKILAYTKYKAGQIESDKVTYFNNKLLETRLKLMNNNVDAINQYLAFIPEIIDSLGRYDTIILAPAYLTLINIFKEHENIDSFFIFSEKYFDIVKHNSSWVNESNYDVLFNYAFELFKKSKIEKSLDLFMFLLDNQNIRFDTEGGILKGIYLCINSYLKFQNLQDFSIDSLIILDNRLASLESANSHEVIEIRLLLSCVHLIRNDTITFYDKILQITEQISKSNNWQNHYKLFEPVFNYISLYEYCPIGFRMIELIEDKTKNLNDADIKLHLSFIKSILLDNIGLTNQAKEEIYMTLSLREKNNYSFGGFRLKGKLVELYLKEAEYYKADSLLNEMDLDISKIDTQNYLSKFDLKNNRAVLYSALGKNYLAKKAIEELLKELNSNNNSDIFPDCYGLPRLLNNLGFVNIKINQLDSAENCFKSSIDFLVKNCLKSQSSLANAYNGLSLIYSIKGYSGKAISYMEKALLLLDSFEYREIDKCNITGNIAELYRRKNNFEDSEKYFKMALNCEAYGMTRLAILVNAGSLYQENDRYKIADSVFIEAAKEFQKLITTNLNFPSEEILESFVSSVSYNLDILKNWFIEANSFKVGNTEMAYNLELSYKSLILNKLIKDKFNSINNLGLVPNAEVIKRDLKLRKNVIAIEFSTFRYRNITSWTDLKLYVALIIKPGEEKPILVPLFEQSKLEKVMKRIEFQEASHVNYIYNNLELYELIWKPLEQHIIPGDIVFYSPSGLLHQISFAAIQKPDGTFISDDYDLKMVSSTGVIVGNQDKDKSIIDIAIFGGMDYEVKEEDISKALQNIQKNEEYVSRGLGIQDSTRYGKWTYLPGTKKEAENIYQIGTNANIPSKFFTGAEALEEQFKSLNGDKSPTILHIATHGFFFPDPKISKEQLEMMSIQRDSPYSLADNPMNRSGLLFSGSNKAWIGDSISVGRDDGILTAYEASHTYLKNTELVVLSACETGLGDIKGSEGVYGLQRAFKMAGARYLLMSLWKVPDNATQEFMTTFYTELLTNKLPIRSAYNMAQNAMKAKYRNEPYKWAGFVLME